MCARVPTCDMSVARPRTNAQHYAGCASATYDLGTYERSHRLTLGGRSARRIQGRTGGAKTQGVPVKAQCCMLHIVYNICQHRRAMLLRGAMLLR